MLIYYVYAYLRDDGTPYYIGKGKGNRAWVSHKRSNGQEVRPKSKDRIVIVERNLTNVGASAIERRLIRWYGRKFEGGILINIQEGGQGKEPGSPMSTDTKRKISNSLKGHFVSDETRQKKSIQRKGFKLPNEIVERIRLKNTGRKLSEQTKEKMKNSAKSRPVLHCPHCHKEGRGIGMRMYHFKNCSSLTPLDV